MSYVTIEDRVDRLEAVFGQFLTEMALVNKRADDRNRLAEERHNAAEERLGRFQGEMRDFKDEMRAFKEEMRQARKDLDRKWGDLANKMGTIIEDILAPNLRRLAREHFRFERIDDFMIRRSRRQSGQSKAESEFDTLVVGPEAVILGEAKSRPSLEYVEAFAGKVSTFFEFFPEYEGKRLIPIFGSWSIPDPLVEELTARRIYAMRMGEETMELANAAALEAAPAG
jgi:hypothetical protein